MQETGTKGLSRISNDAELLSWITYYIQQQGFTFSYELVADYYTALKTKPFVILTGISGTGKTRLTKLFADALTEENTGHYLLISVAPDWTDNSALRGYYNVVQERQVETDFSLFYRVAQDVPAEPFFVCLDEMNLAKVEHYFSHFLSQMEMATTPRNLYVTGTVNVDESTYQFSKKVLDRANTIEFNEVRLGDRPAMTRVTPSFSFQERREMYRIFMACPEVGWDDGVLDVLGRVNDILGRRNMQFAYRVRNEVLRFIANSAGFLPKNDALDLQLLQKVLPRLDGTKEQVEKILMQLLAFFLALEVQELPQAIEALYLMNPGQYNGCLYPRSAKKTARMLARVREDGFVTFYE